MICRAAGTLSLLASAGFDSTDIFAIAGKNRFDVDEFARILKNKIPKMKDALLLGPVSASISLIKGKYRSRLLLKYPQEAFPQKFLKDWLKTIKIKKNISLTVDVFIDLGFSVWHKERIRLSGIDTAEKNTPLGKALKTYMISLLEGKLVKLEVSKPDKYGRYLGKIYLDSEESINDQLIKVGLAKPYGGDSKVGLWTEEELAKTTITAILK